MKYAIKISNYTGEFTWEFYDKDECYFRETYQSNCKKYLRLRILDMARTFKSSRNAKNHLKKLIDTCEGLNNRCKYSIVELDDDNNILSEESITIRKLTEEVLVKNPKYNGAEYYIDKLSKVMKRLSINEYEYNWDKDSAFIKFVYKGQFYKFDHKATEENKLTYGTDCLAQLVLTLEDLARMSERKIYDFAVWISAMKYLPEKTLLPKCFQDLGFKYDYPSRMELDKAYKELLKIVHPDNGGNNSSFIKLRESYNECLKQI